MLPEVLKRTIAATLVYPVGVFCDRETLASVALACGVTSKLAVNEPVSLVPSGYPVQLVLPVVHAVCARELELRAVKRKNRDKNDWRKSLACTCTLDPVLRPSFWIYR